MNLFPKIHTQRCRLDNISCDDIFILQQIFNDDETKQYLQELNDLVSTEEGVKIFIDSFNRYADNNEGFLWGIYLDCKLVGFIAIMDISYNPTLFYAVHPNYRSQGIMKECATQVLNYISEKNICGCIQSEVYKRNYISIRLLESIGFEKTGCNKQKIFLYRRFRCTVNDRI